jgi:hypothetical protein
MLRAAVCAMTALRKSSEAEPERVLHAPPSPRSVAETGLEVGFLVDLMVKTVYRMTVRSSRALRRSISATASAWVAATASTRLSLT